MNHLLTFLLVLPVAALAQFTPSSSEKYERAVSLSASAILRTDVLRGPYHRVREAVPTSGGVNTFTIDSDFGVFTAEGNSLLMMRVQEIYALAELREISATEEFAEALKRAGKGQLRIVENTVKDPVGTAKSVPKGAVKFFKGIGAKAKDATQGRQRSDYEDNALKEIAGVSKVKRQLAVQLGVNPYSSNAVLQRELDKVAQAAAAGGGLVSLGSMALPTGVSTALRVAAISQDTREEIRSADPNELFRTNLAKLTRMGIGEAAAKSFLNNPALSPWHATLTVNALAGLRGVAGRAEYVRLVDEVAQDESDALFAVTTALLIAQLHQTTEPLARITVIDRYPLCIGKDGSIVLALRWDYAQWTAFADKIGRRLKEFGAKTSEKPDYLIALTGATSPRFRAELAERGFRLRDNLAPGPLR